MDQLTRDALTVLYESLETVRPEIEFEQVLPHNQGSGDPDRNAERVALGGTDASSARR